jgi:hypothetical protein
MGRIFTLIKVDYSFFFVSCQISTSLFIAHTKTSIER